MSTSAITPRQYAVLADFVAAGDPLPVAALAAGLLPPVAEAAIAEAPWFEAVVETSRRLQEMRQPEWLDRARRLMRGVIERALAEERVSLLHLAARQIDALAPEKFTPDDERRGVQALLHAMSTMTHAQLDEWQGLSRRVPAGGTAPEPPAASSPVSPTPPVPPSAVPPSPGPSSAMPSPAMPIEAEAAAGPAAAVAGDPRFAPAPAIVAPAAEPQADPWPFAAEATPEIDAQTLRPAPAGKVCQPVPADTVIRPAPHVDVIRPVPPGAVIPPVPAGGAGSAAVCIPMPRVVLAQLPRGRPLPGWLAPEPPGRPAARPP